uniref:Beta-toxin To4 n=1 Tax=Tityus obscurus TaxID=1221240 RepID=SCX4_TITOB|nr:RecName: Full=Beta-toxin To4; AltName: Full=PT-beta* NaTx13.9; AltName: Full=Toxin Tc54; Flags: Precursor [Tityus obscurus]WDU65886.1 putative NaTx Tcis41 [Tityus cisandinus]CCD31421.1 scorpion toxin To4 precursor [Tityus obscurus]
MTRFVLFISCFFLIGMIVECKDGYLMEYGGCKMSCLMKKGTFCAEECTRMKGKDGYCYAWLACYCYNMPDWVKIWNRATNKCGKRK